MKMYPATKRKMAEQRKKRIRQYFNGRGEQSIIYSFQLGWKTGNCRLISKHELDGEYYFVLEEGSHRLVVAKLVYAGYVKIIKLSTKNFNKRRDVFDIWLKEAKVEAKRCNKIRNHYRNIIIYG